MDAALAESRNPITVAWLLPYASSETSLRVATRLDPAVAAALGRVASASARHLALVEATRLAYQRAMKAKDREDKARFQRS